MMALTKEPFRRYKLDTERTESDEQPFTVRLTDADKRWFKSAQVIIKQPKKSTALKQLAEIGAMIVIHDKKVTKILDVLSGNLRRNKRIGIPGPELSSQESDANVTQMQGDL
jgi:hypothetical protein